MGMWLWVAFRRCPLPVDVVYCAGGGGGGVTDEGALDAPEDSSASAMRHVAVTDSRYRFLAWIENTLNEVEVSVRGHCCLIETSFLPYVLMWPISFGNLPGTHTRIHKRASTRTLPKISFPLVTRPSPTLFRQ